MAWLFQESLAAQVYRGIGVFPIDKIVLQIDFDVIVFKENDGKFY
jgi:hypothetical protein